MNGSGVVLEPTKKRAAWMQQASRLYGDWPELSEKLGPGTLLASLCGVLGDGFDVSQSSTDMENPIELCSRELWERERGAPPHLKMGKLRA